MNVLSCVIEMLLVSRKGRSRMIEAHVNEEIITRTIRDFHNPSGENEASLTYSNMTCACGGDESMTRVM